MPLHQYKCDDEVKKYFKECHKKCHKKKYCTEVTGIFLNKFIQHRPFNRNQKYCICDNLKRCIDQGKIKQLTPESRIQHNQESIERLQADGAIEPPVVVGTPNGLLDELPSHNEQSDRATRLSRRNMLKQVQDSVSSIEEQPHTEVENTPPPIRNNPAPPYYKPFYTRVSLYSKNYRVAYQNIKWKQRLYRHDDCLALIIASCLDKKEWNNESDKNLRSYVEGNQELAKTCLNVINTLRLRLSEKLKIDIPGESEAVEPIDLIDGDEAKEEDNNEMNKLAISILSETTNNGYGRVRKELNRTASTSLPSLHVLNKLLPLKVDNVCFDCTSVDDDTCSHDDILVGFDPLPVPGPDDALLLSSRAEDANGKAYGSKLEGSLKDYVDVMMNKLENKFNDDDYKIKDGEDELIMINSFDGAEAIKTEKKVSSVISYSSQVLVPSLVQSKQLRPASSFNILTWMQILGKEELKLLLSSTSNFLKERRELYEKRVTATSYPTSKHWIYDVHDAKMLFLLTQHSQWNRKFHPFLLCKCKRGDHIFDESHECQMLNDQQYKDNWNTSKQKWEWMMEQQNSVRWDVQKHKEWCDEKTFGITHFGMDPEFFPIGSIRFDAFHMACAVIRRVMHTLRLFILKQSSNCIKSFTDDVLKSFLNEYHIYCWNNKLKLSSFQGNDLFNFVEQEAVIRTFLSSNLAATQECKSIGKSIQILRKILKFLTMTYIKDAQLYISEMEQFENNLKEFYSCGKMSFLKSSDDESFYLHCLRFYTPKMAKITFERHGLGLGIFTMQGFERRNKESKNLIRRSSSGNRKKETMLNNNVKRLEQVFLFESNAY